MPRSVEEFEQLDRQPRTVEAFEATDTATPEPQAPQPEEDLFDERVSMLRIPRFDPAKAHDPRGKLGTTIMNLLLGGAEIAANFPGMLIEGAREARYGGDEPTSLDIISPEGKVQVPEIAKGLVRPVAKLAAGIKTRGETEAGKELFEESLKETMTRPESVILPFLIAAGARGAGKGRVAKAGKAPKVPVKRGIVSDIIPKERIPTERVPIVEEILGVEKTKVGKDVTLYRGTARHQTGKNYYSPDKEFARQFTQSGLDSEIKTIKVSSNEIYRPKELPDATRLSDADLSIIQEAKDRGFKGVWMDEGLNQPESVYMLSKPKPAPSPRGVKPKLEVAKREVKPEAAPRGKAKVAETPTDVSIQNVIQALKEAKPARKAQEVLFAKERSARLAKLLAVRGKTTGEKGFQAELGQLRGELPKVEFESIRGKISQIDIDNIFNKVKDADILTDWEKITAREGLAKMLTEYGGRVPTRGELTLLEQVFPVEFIETVMSKRPLGAKLGEAALQLINVPRSIMASFDLSFGGRQGAFAAPKFRRQFWNSWKKQFKIFGSEKAYQASREALVADKDFKFAKKNRVSFTEIGKVLTQREESFQSQWAEKIPLVGRGVRASGRAYTAFANKYRLDIFKKLVDDAEALGIEPRKNPFLTRKMADFVNNATGRGSLGQFENAAVALNAVFFSPRLNMARMRLLNPVYYVRQPKHLRKQALSTALHAAGAATTILTAAKLGGLGVTADPRNADFGKIKIGNTRLDMLAGFGQFIRGAAQITSGQYVSSTTGKTVTLGEGYRPLTRMDLLIRQIESKEAPVASFATGILRGKNWAGEPISIPKEVGSRFVPMVIADAVDIVKDDPSLIPLALPAVFGIGVQTYTKRKRKKKTRSILSKIGI